MKFVTIPKIIGARVKASRKKAKLTQAELAELVGYKSRVSIHKIESCISAPGKDYLIKIADVLNVSYYYLTGATDDPERTMMDEFLVDTCKDNKSSPDDGHSFYISFTNSQRSFIDRYLKYYPDFSNEDIGTLDAVLEALHSKAISRQ